MFFRNCRLPLQTELFMNRVIMTKRGFLYVLIWMVGSLFFTYILLSSLFPQSRKKASTEVVTIPVSFTR